MKDPVLYIPKIRDGIVIDHIPAGRGIAILAVLRARWMIQDLPVSLGLNYSSNKMGRKDIIKINNDDIPPELMHIISIICPGVTVKRVRNFAVEKKYVLDTPACIDAVLLCRNPGCISNHERQLQPRFMKQSASDKYKCYYCERTFALAELELASEVT